MKSLHTKLVLSALGFALLAGPAVAQTSNQYRPISTRPISGKWSFAAKSWAPIPMRRFGPS